MTEKSIDNYKTLNLNHKSSYLKQSQEQFLVASREGMVSIFTKEAEKLYEIDLKEEIKSIDFISNSNIIIYSTKEHLNIIDYQKNKIKKFSMKEASIYIQNGLLWSVSKISCEELYIQVFTLNDWKEVASLSMEDELHDSACLWAKGYDDKSLVLWLAAGQDGYCNYLLRFDGELSVDSIGNNDSSFSTFSIIFYKIKKQFIVGDDEGLSVFNYPTNELISQYTYPKESYPTNYYDFLNEHKILLHTENSLDIYDIELRKTVEVSIKGHERKPTSFYYPSLCDDYELTTDIDYFELFDELILFACSNNRVEPTKYSLLLIDRVEFSKNLVT